MTSGADTSFVADSPDASTQVYVRSLLNRKSAINITMCLGLTLT
jgi:hypothetical protein